jgi:hypothetical protein
VRYNFSSSVLTACFVRGVCEKKMDQVPQEVIKYIIVENGWNEGGKLFKLLK